MKAIDCLRSVYKRCQDDAKVKAELDMLYSVADWQEGKALLCEDLNRKLGMGSRVTSSHSWHATSPQLLSN